MPKIYDNIEQYFSQGLIETIELSKRCDFCVECFKIRCRYQKDKINGMSVKERQSSSDHLLVGYKK